MSLQAKKSLGQNFLKSHKAIRAMIDSSKITPEDTIIEIGPGKGALTKPLLETGATIIAFELDQRMIEFLQEKFETYIKNGKLILMHQDILEADINKYTKGKPYKLIANIPYYITNLILRTFLSGEYQPITICLLVQKEVAQRIVTRDNKESILSLSVKLYGTPKYIMKVARHYFNPSPKVDSAIILVENIGRDSFTSQNFENSFFEVVRMAFSQKRKKAIKNLQKLSERNIWENIFNDCSVSIDARAEDISFREWLMIIDKYIK